MSLWSVLEGGLVVRGVCVCVCMREEEGGGVKVEEFWMGGYGIESFVVNVFVVRVGSRGGL